MIDLGALQNRINDDPALRARFIADPVKVLAAEGITISPSMQASLVRLIKAQTSGPPDVLGSSVTEKPGASNRDRFGLP
jgi:hypothetical protein